MGADRLFKGKDAFQKLRRGGGVDAISRFNRSMARNDRIKPFFNLARFPPHRLQKGDDFMLDRPIKGGNAEQFPGKVFDLPGV